MKVVWMYFEIAKEFYTGCAYCLIAMSVTECFLDATWAKLCDGKNGFYGTLSVQIYCLLEKPIIFLTLALSDSMGRHVR